MEVIKKARLHVLAIRRWIKKQSKTNISTPTLKNFIKQRGFKEVFPNTHGCGYGGEVFKHEDSTWIKLNGTVIVDSWTIPKKLRVSTYWAYYGKNMIRVQPEVKTNKQSVRKARRFLTNEFEKLGNDQIDLHDGNIGVFFEKPVMFDW
jgi:hypothetical protein